MFKHLALTRCVSGTIIYIIFMMFAFSKLINPMFKDIKKDLTNISTIFEYIDNNNHWNIHINPVINVELESDITPNIYYFIQTYQANVQNILHSKLLKFDQTTNWNVKKIIGVRTESIDNETLTLLVFQMVYQNSSCLIDENFFYIEAYDSHNRRISYNLQKNNRTIIKIPTILPVSQMKMNRSCMNLLKLQTVIHNKKRLSILFDLISCDRKEILFYDLLNDYQSMNFLETVPFIKNDKIYSIYSYEPLSILECSMNVNKCQMISTMPSINKSKHSLESGTQLIRFPNSNYFVGFVNSKISCDDECQYLSRPRIAIFEKYDLIYLSEPIKFDSIPLFASLSILSETNSTMTCYGNVQNINFDFIIDSNWLADKVSVILLIENQRSFLVNIYGIKKILESIINIRKNNIQRNKAKNNDQCQSLFRQNKFQFENDLIQKRNMKGQVIKGMIKSPTYPSFQVVSNTDDENLKSWIQSDYINFGLIGRYLIDYEQRNDPSERGTSLMIDAGGNHATYGLYAAALNQTVQIFEVLPKYLIVIEESIRINNKFQNRIFLNKYGVSDQYETWNILPDDGTTRLDFSNVHSSNVSQNNSMTIASYAIDSFIFQKVSVMKIDVEGFEIRALKGANRTISFIGVGAILIEIASYRWIWNNITINEGISVLERVTSIGNYIPYIITRQDTNCPESAISKMNHIRKVEDLYMINMQNGTRQIAPYIYRLNSWEPIINEMKVHDWSCNFWLEAN